MPLEKSFDPTEEAALYAAWEAAGAFRAGAGARREETFSILIPPPNVTGVLHMGHAFNNTLQDVLTRWHRMRGYDTLWQPGTDHAGIATQMVVERELAKTNRRRTDMSREEFTALVWKQKRASRGTIIGQLKRLGASCDWSREAFTMSGAPDAPEGEEGNFHNAVIRVFVDLYEKGLIYRGKRLVNWDPKFETAISDLEVENVETDGFMWHFRYPLQGGETYEYVERGEDGRETLRETRDWISIATTRPETMLGDGAVAVHPSDERYAPIVGKLVEIPVGPKAHRRMIPIITDDYPDPAFGSGAVKITGAHDFNDYGVATRNGIPLYSLMDTRGAMRADGLPYEEAAARAQAIAEGAEAPADATEINLVPEHLRGLDRFDARAKIVEEITAEGLAVMVPPTDPRLGAPSRSGKPAAPASAPGPRGAMTASDHGAPDRVRGGASPAGNAGSPPPSSSGSTGGSPAPDARPPNPSSSGSTGGSPRPKASQAVGDPRIKSEDDAIPAGAPSGTPPLAPEEGGAPRTEPDALVPLVEPKQIMQPMGDRSKVVIEPMLTDQWFVDTAKIVGPALEAVRFGEITILPDQDRKVYEHWLENIEPWTISRQLWWGHRIPVWYGMGTEEPGPNESFWGQTVGLGTAEKGEQELRMSVRRFCAASKGQALKEAHECYGVEVEEVADEKAFRSRVLQRIGDPSLPMPIYQDPDVLDTWFSSGLWPIGTLGWPEDTEAFQKYFPTSTLITGFDIIFFWVARMIMMQYAVVGQRPFDTVYVHALVRDEKGAKMSKSLGNVLDPIDLIDSYGADAVRFTLASMAAMGRDLRLSTKRIEGYRNFGTKLWNAARFAELNGAWDAHPMRMDRASDVHALCPVNSWIVGETARAFAAHDAALQAYRFDDAARGAYAFVWGTVCDWYLELSKPLLTGEDPDLKAETQATVAWVIDRCLILLHPVMPFVTEALWSRLGAREAMLALTPWPDFPNDLNDEAADAEIAWTISLIEAIRSVRGEMNVPAGAFLPLIATERSPEAEGYEARNLPLLQRLARVEDITAGEAPKGAATITVRGATYALPLAGAIDVGAEKSRLDKALTKLAKEVGGLRKRLENPHFAASAPPEVVTETRANLEAREAEQARLEAARARLEEMG